LGTYLTRVQAKTYGLDTNSYYSTTTNMDSSGLQTTGSQVIGNALPLNSYFTNALNILTRPLTGWDIGPYQIQTNRPRRASIITIKGRQP
jgi:hypothetical protein